VEGVAQAERLHALNGGGCSESDAMTWRSKRGHVQGYESVPNIASYFLDCAATSL
jgi:hypothetical protein